MNTILLKKLLKTTGGSVLLSLCFSGTVLAQQTPPANTPPAVPYVTPATVDSSYWTYKLPAATAQASPTIDQGSAIYLPWIGKNLVGLLNYADFFYQQQKNTIGCDQACMNYNAGTQAANNLLSSTQGSNMAAASATTQTEFQAVANFFPGPSALVAYASVPGTDTTTLSPTDPNYPTNAQFNADALLGVTGYGYDKTTTNNMTTLIAFLSNLTQRLTPPPGFSAGDKPEARASLLQQPEVQSYILATRTLASLQSMALSNFNYLSQERLQIQGLGTQIGMTTFPTDGTTPKPIADASQLDVEKYLIDKRLNNPDWYKSMNTANSISVQRETLFVLTEMQRQIFELRMINERLLATMSTMQMSLFQMSKGQLDARLQAAQITQSNASASAPNTSTQPPQGQVPPGVLPNGS